MGTSSSTLESPNIDIHDVFNDQYRIKIYTDWANHYLEKARNKRFISDLQQDVSDGVLLADVIEAVSKYLYHSSTHTSSHYISYLDNSDAVLLADVIEAVSKYLYPSSTHTSSHYISYLDISDGVLLADVIKAVSKYLYHSSTHTSSHSYLDISDGVLLADVIEAVSKYLYHSSTHTSSHSYLDNSDAVLLADVIEAVSKYLYHSSTHTSSHYISYLDNSDAVLLADVIEAVSKYLYPSSTHTSSHYISYLDISDGVLLADVIKAVSKYLYHSSTHTSSHSYLDISDGVLLADVIEAVSKYLYHSSTHTSSHSYLDISDGVLLADVIEAVRSYSYLDISDGVLLADVIEAVSKYLYHSSTHTSSHYISYLDISDGVLLADVIEAVNKYLYPSSTHTSSHSYLDISDGVLLADVIEAVTNEKIREIKSKPKNTAQMVENINTCLTFLANLGVSVEGLSAKDIKDGNLKAILGLFFSLSRYKQQQKTQQKQEHNKCHSGETTHQSSGSSKNQLSSSDSQSRLPSPFKSGNSKCPTITNPSTKPSSGSKSTSKSSADKHLNQQNNNQQSATLPAGSSLNTVKSSHPSSRATSPAVPGSGIPTPGGRSLTTPRPSGEKQPRVVSTGSTTSTSSTASNKSTSQKSAPQNKNSMLDKFKFFNSKDKSKGKSGVPKSTSKTSTGSTASTSSSSLALSSDRDSRISTDTRSSTASARSSSSTDPGAISFSPESESPKLPPKTKSLGKTVNKKEHPSTLPLAQNEKLYSSSASDHGSGVKKSSSKTDLKSGQKGTKIGTLIPSKSASKSSKSTSSTPTSTGIRTPTSIPKPGKSRSKDEKSKSHSQSSSAATSPSVSGVPSTKHSGLSAYGSPSVGSHSKQHYETISDHSKTSVQDSDKMLQMKGRYTEIDYSDGKIDRVGDGQYSKSSSKMSGYQSGIQKPSVNKEGNLQQTVNVVKPTCSVANTQMHAMTGISDLNTQSGIINRALPPPLPKTEPPPRSNTPSMKDHSNNSMPHGAKNESPGSPTGQSSISGHKSDSTSSSSSHSGPSGNNSNSSTESVIYRPSDSGSDVGSISATSSPRLGLKVLQPQQPINKSANNVAIVQPRHGEKVETTFDSEVRTKTVNKDKEKSSKETTFSEKETTFVDDSGEAMDIKPMQPILRAMPYGTGYLRGYTTPPGKIFHNPGYATPTATYFASTSRLGMNRPLMDHGKFYSGPIRKTPSSGLNSSFDGDYSSDYESFDYISGYMSDGDILKGSQNKVDEMNCGYMSEGGASLYARRLQQRFREGMQAVKESMQKNNGMIDDDRQHHRKFQPKRRQSVPRSVR
ncbi:unnamed protein product [Mytilus coruscus]|uniref:Calponin-homology (CH) domain-containing protein n=1 Tax=Mytilus coruscus TaxID=42192 RepID=A0A6J7ZX09_MYTCO|nr:unnamed protein product [Mytilus coruscus]